MFSEPVQDDTVTLKASEPFASRLAVINVVTDVPPAVVVFSDVSHVPTSELPLPLLPQPTPTTASASDAKNPVVRIIESPSSGELPWAQRAQARVPDKARAGSFFGKDGSGESGVGTAFVGARSGRLKRQTATLRDTGPDLDYARGRMSDPGGIPALIEAIRRLHGAEAEHLETVHIDECQRGEHVWSGDVEVFTLTGHPEATKAYAWSEVATGTKRRFFVALHEGSIDSPIAALRASILADVMAADRARRTLS